VPFLCGFFCSFLVFSRSFVSLRLGCRVPGQEPSVCALVPVFLTIFCFVCDLVVVFFINFCLSIFTFLDFSFLFLRLDCRVSTSFCQCWLFLSISCWFLPRWYCFFGLYSVTVRLDSRVFWPSPVFSGLCFLCYCHVLPFVTHLFDLSPSFVCFSSQFSRCSPCHVCRSFLPACLPGFADLSCCVFCSDRDGSFDALVRLVVLSFHISAQGIAFTCVLERLCWLFFPQFSHLLPSLVCLVLSLRVFSRSFVGLRLSCRVPGQEPSVCALVPVFLTIFCFVCALVVVFLTNFCLSIFTFPVFSFFVFPLCFFFFFFFFSFVFVGSLFGVFLYPFGFLGPVLCFSRPLSVSVRIDSSVSHFRLFRFAPWLSRFDLILSVLAFPYHLVLVSASMVLFFRAIFRHCAPRFSCFLAISGLFWPVFPLLLPCPSVCHSFI